MNIKTVSVKHLEKVKGRQERTAEEYVKREKRSNIGKPFGELYRKGFHFNEFKSGGLNEKNKTVPIAQKSPCITFNINKVVNTLWGNKKGSL
jgi:hypothetical protein